MIVEQKRIFPWGVPGVREFRTIRVDDQTDIAVVEVTNRGPQAVVDTWLPGARAPLHWEFPAYTRTIMHVPMNLPPAEEVWINGELFATNISVLIPGYTVSLPNPGRALA